MGSSRFTDGVPRLNWPTLLSQVRITCLAGFIKKFPSLLAYDYLEYFVVSHHTLCVGFVEISGVMFSV